jgi:WD40 repeat protein
MEEPKESFINFNQVVSASNECSAKFISFNPFDHKSLCTSGDDGIIKFWHVKAGLKKFSLVPVKGKNVVAANSDAHEITPYNHVWVHDNTIITTTASGDEVYSYNTDSGTPQVVFSVVRDVPTQPPTFAATMNGANMHCILRNKNSFILGGKVVNF